MKNPTRTFEHVYIYMTGFSTKVDGDIMALFPMDGFSEFAFKPILNRRPLTDAGLFEIIDNCFESILSEYIPGKHSNKITFITNLPDILAEYISEILPDNCTIVFDAAVTKRKVQPLLASLKKHMGK